MTAAPQVTATHRRGAATVAARRSPLAPRAEWVWVPEMLSWLVRRHSGVAEVLPGHVEAVRLYENYLTTFAINRGRCALRVVRLSARGSGRLPKASPRADHVTRAAGGAPLVFEYDESYAGGPAAMPL